MVYWLESWNYRVQHVVRSIIVGRLERIGAKGATRRTRGKPLNVMEWPHASVECYFSAFKAPRAFNIVSNGNGSCFWGSGIGD